MPAPARRSDLLGISLTALCGGALALNLLLVIGLLGLLAINGGGFFWQKSLTLFTLDDGTRVLGEVHEREAIPQGGEEDGDVLHPAHRVLVKSANRDLTGTDFQWIDERRIRSRSVPEDAVLLQRLEWGNFHGRLVGLRKGDQVLASEQPEAWSRLLSLLETKKTEATTIRRLEKGEIGEVNRRIEELRLEERRLSLPGVPAAQRDALLPGIARRTSEQQALFDGLAVRLSDLRSAYLAEVAVMEAADGTRKDIPIGQIVRAILPNTLGTASRLRLYLDRLWEFLSADPRESNTEGGIFPAIFGTVMMVFLMSFAVTPLGVLAALYLREYAAQGPLVRMVRIAVNNLAGVPSIVFGVFGLGFFVYLVGATIDRMFYPEALPSPTFGTGGILWASLTLALLTVPVVIVATEEGLAAVPRIVREGSLALGATKFETTWRVVIPAAAPGILTGMILAMARAAGEVAPLMIVGMVKLAPALPVDGTPPFLHLERKFMHLGFHIYDLGFQSPNVEATKPLVFATALLLILVVTAMNLTAVAVRNHLRRKYASSAI